MVRTLRSRIALVSLGVPAANLKVVGRGEHRRLAELAAVYGDTSATVLMTGTSRWPIAPGVTPKWKPVFID